MSKVNFEIGNPQETLKLLKPEEWGWLAGIIDGEGSIQMMVCQKGTKNWEGNGVRLKVNIVNTDTNIIKKYCELLRRIGIEPYLRMSNGTTDTCVRKDAWNADITRMRDMCHFLNGIRPHLAGEKKAKAELLMQFVERRITYKGEHSQGKGASWYVENDWTIVKDFYNLCRKELPEQIQRLLREHTCSSPRNQELGKMMCSELTRDCKTTAEMTAANAK